VQPALHVSRYFYQQSYAQYSNESTSYTINVVADRDKDSKSEDGWESTLLTGVLTRDVRGHYSAAWGSSIALKSKINEGGRGMELSDLVYFNGRLYTFDDRTGIVFQVDKAHGAIPQHILMDGNGSSSKGFKCEWATVKDDRLYVGGLGKEWTSPEGEVISRDPQWVKVIDTEGRVFHQNWVPVYEALRKATGTTSPGYLIHEAVRFHPVSRRWYFLPRRVSAEAYNDALDERRGANVMISTNEMFEDIKVSHIGPQNPTHGFSSFAFVPFRENEFVALKTEEVDGNIATYITVLNLHGEVLLEETKIGDVKFEGVEFL
jgi:soluble calcium-activated nucleotidase 1